MSGGVGFVRGSDGPWPEAENRRRVLGNRTGSGPGKASKSDIVIASSCGAGLGTRHSWAVQAHLISAMGGDDR